MVSLRSAVRRRRLRSIGLRLAFLWRIPLAAGFGLFIWLLPEQEVALDRNADGIVVLTGGTSRVSDALELLASGRGKRLLIPASIPVRRPTTSPIKPSTITACSAAASISIMPR